MKIGTKIVSVSFAVVGLLAIFGMMGFHAKKPDLHALSGIVEYTSAQAPLKQVSHGSGVFVDARHVLTASHVVAWDVDDEKVNGRVRLPDGDLYRFKKIRKSKKFDLAMITLDRPYRGVTDFPKFDCDPTKPGQVYTTIGNPLSVEFIDVEIRATGGRPNFLYGVEQNEDRNGKVVLPFETEKPHEETNLNPKYKVIPPDQLPKGDPQAELPKLEKEKQAQKQEPVNVKGATFFQGPALPGQSGSPVYDKDGNIRGVLIITLYDQDQSSYSGLGMYVDSPAVCEFIKNQKLAI